MLMNPRPCKIIKSREHKLIFFGIKLKTTKTDKQASVTSMSNKI